MGSRFDDEFCVNCVADKVDWYSPCVRQIRGGVSESNVCGIIGWLVVCVCGRGLSGCVFVKGV